MSAQLAGGGTARKCGRRAPWQLCTVPGRDQSRGGLQTDRWVEPTGVPLLSALLPCAGNRDKNVVKCPCCESQLTFDADKRQVSVTELAA